MGETVELSATVYPSDADYQKVIWSSGDPYVARVGAHNGRVLGQSAGTVTIYAEAQDGSGVIGSIIITVTANEEYGNTTDVESLVKAQKDPEQYAHLIVRVGGFSARFVTLKKELQDDIINRIRHIG